LLVTQFPIRSDEQIEARFFRCIEQSPILQTRPALISGRDNRMAALDDQPQFLRNAIIEGNFIQRATFPMCS
jgi:hypothetical protein